MINTESQPLHLIQYHRATLPPLRMLFEHFLSQFQIRCDRRFRPRFLLEREDHPLRCDEYRTAEEGGVGGADRAGGSNEIEDVFSCFAYRSERGRRELLDRVESADECGGGIRTARGESAQIQRRRKRDDERAVEIDDSSTRDQPCHQRRFFLGCLNRRRRVQARRMLTGEKGEILANTFESFESSDRYCCSSRRFRSDNEER